MSCMKKLFQKKIKKSSFKLTASNKQKFWQNKIRCYLDIGFTDSIYKIAEKIIDKRRRAKKFVCKTIRLSFRQYKNLWYLKTNLEEEYSQNAPYSFGDVCEIILNLPTKSLVDNSYGQSLKATTIRLSSNAYETLEKKKPSYIDRVKYIYREQCYEQYPWKINVSFNDILLAALEQFFNLDYENLKCFLNKVNVINAASTTRIVKLRESDVFTKSELSLIKKHSTNKRKISENALLHLEDNNFWRIQQYFREKYDKNYTNSHIVEAAILAFEPRKVIFEM